MLLLLSTITVIAEAEGSLLPGCLPCSVAYNFNFGLGLRSLSSYLIDYRGGEKIPKFDFMTLFYLSDPVNSHLPVFISFCLISPSCVNGKSPPGISLSLTLIYQTLPKNCFTYPCLRYHSRHFGKWQICCHLFPNCSVCPNASPFFQLAATLLWRSLTSWIFFFWSFFFKCFL